MQGIIPHLLVVLWLTCARTDDTRNDEDVEVQTEYGMLVGKRIEHNWKGLEKEMVTPFSNQFYGIPYAKPPVASLRFKSPQPLDRWDGKKNAFKKAHSCPQSSFSDVNEGQSYEYQDEDCLYLNVYSPYNPQQPDAKYAVMLFVHGGSYESGSGHVYDGRVLSTLGVVVVTFNYRLGALGFLLSGDDHLAGNYGLEDQIMVMKWVKKNIAAFGGNADNVMLVGHSVGAALVGIHMTIDESKGLFHSVVAQSGSASASYAIYHDDMDINFKLYVFDVSYKLGCGYDGKGSSDKSNIKLEGIEYDERMKSVVECLRGVNVEDFILLRNKFPHFDKFGVEFRPYLDGKLIKQTIHEAINTGNFYHVPYITGVVQREFDFYMEDILNKSDADLSMDWYLYRNFHSDQRVVNLLKFNYIDWPTTLSVNKHHYHISQSNLGGLNVPSHTNFSDSIFYYRNSEMLSDFNMVAPTLQMADLLSEHSTEVYYYYFSVPKSYHSIELSYLFGSPFGAEAADESKQIQYNSTLPYNSPIKTISKIVMNLWTSFAKTKKLPSMEGGVTWPRYDSKTRKYLNFSHDGVNIYSHLNIEKAFLWNELVPNLFPEISHNALGDGGTILKTYPSTFNSTLNKLMTGNKKENNKTKETHLNTILTTLLVLAAIVILLLFLVIFKLRRKTHKLEKVCKLYNSEHATNL